MGLNESEGLSVVKSWGTLDYSGVRLINELKKIIKEIINIVPNEKATEIIENRRYSLENLNEKPIV